MACVIDRGLELIETLCLLRRAGSVPKLQKALIHREFGATNNTKTHNYSTEVDALYAPYAAKFTRLRI